MHLHGRALGLILGLDLPHAPEVVGLGEQRRHLAHGRGARGLQVPPVLLLHLVLGARARRPPPARQGLPQPPQRARARAAGLIVRRGCLRRRHSGAEIALGRGRRLDTRMAPADFRPPHAPVRTEGRPCGLPSPCTQLPQTRPLPSSSPLELSQKVRGLFTWRHCSWTRSSRQVSGGLDAAGWAGGGIAGQVSTRSWGRGARGRMAVPVVAAAGGRAPAAGVRPCPATRSSARDRQRALGARRLTRQPVHVHLSPSPRPRSSGSTPRYP